MPSELIDTPEELSRYLQAERSRQTPPLCAIDTEADSLHRYRESLCLVQFASGTRSVLIDPLAIEDLSSLGAFLSDAVVWMHGADYDMTMLKRQFNRLPGKVYDTQIGARLLGARKFGLADLVAMHFGVELSKSSQKADWGKRPLSEKMIEYALNDVRYLLPMGQKIVELLHQKGRLEWFEESCKAARQKVLERDELKEDSWRVQGSGRLDEAGLACLRALWIWRDREACAWDRPSFMVATNKQLLEWSVLLAQKKRISLPPHYRSDRLKRFQEMVAELEALAEEDWPKRPEVRRRKKDRAFEKKLDALLKKREEAAQQLEIDGSLLAARSVLESIAAGEVPPEQVLLGWQLECLKIGG